MHDADGMRSAGDAIERLLEPLMSLSGPEQTAALEALCNAHPQLAEQLRRRFATFRELLGKTALPPGNAKVAPPASIGPYRILDTLGEGGMGTVYLAEQREPVRRRVALKLVKLGMDSKAVLVRFEAERRALSMMEHSCIATVLDAGISQQGQPFFVMEYVKGVPITDYCDRNKLGLVERIELFQKVCSGVQHAHLKGVMHRDLKPGNVLVTLQDGQPIPKIIDFGLAKATDHHLVEATLFTEQGVLIGTPEYMSPEQAGLDGLDVDTRTDVYSLGVLLYELLVGELPFPRKALREAGHLEMQRVIREQEPVKPSTKVTTLGASAAGLAAARRVDTGELKRRLRGDLDWIVLRALEKDRTRRYETAAELAADLERHLRFEPVLASPPSIAYRLRKFLRRYRWQSAAAAALFVAIVGGAIGTAMGFQAAKVQARIASENEQQARSNEATAIQRAEEARAETARADRAETVARERAERAERDSYVANVQLAGSYRELGDFLHLARHLEACPERLRGWEWGWLNSQDASLLQLKGHSDRVSDVAYDPAGSRIVTASRDGTARVWDGETGACVATLAGKIGSLWQITFSQDGARLATVGAEGAEVWDVAGWSRVATIPSDRGPRGGMFTADGSRFVACWFRGLSGGSGVSEKSLEFRVFRVATGECLATSRTTDILIHDPANPIAEWTPELDTEDADGDWDTAAKECQWQLRMREWRLVFSPDGSRVLHRGVLHDARTGKMLGEERKEWGLVEGVFDARGLRAVTFDDVAARVLDGTTGAVLSTLEGHAGGVSSAAFRPDGLRVVTGSDDGTARVWDAAGGPVHRHPDRTKQRSGIRGLEVTASRDGRFLLSRRQQSNLVSVADALLGIPVADLEGHRGSIRDASFRPDSLRVVTVSEDKSARLWDPLTGECVMTLNGHEGAIVAASWSMDGARLATASADATARVWDAATGRCTATLRGHTGGVDEAVFSEGNTSIVTRSADGTVKWWRVEDATCIASHTFGVERAREWERGKCVLFGPQGRLVATIAADGAVDVWRGADGAHVRKWTGEPVSSVLAFSNDMKRLACGVQDHLVLIWLDTGVSRSVSGLSHQRARSWGSTSDWSVHYVVFSPDDSRMAIETFGPTQIWDSEGRNRLALVDTGAGGDAWFSSDGRSLLSTSSDGVVVAESTPYRERFPRIQAARAAVASISPRVVARLDAGEDPMAVRKSMLADTSLSPDLHVAAMIAVQAWLDRKRPR